MKEVIFLHRSKQMSDSMLLGVVLTLAGGFQDAYSYNGRGGVFANAQTGNIVLLGQNLALGEWGKSPCTIFFPAALVSSRCFCCGMDSKPL